MKRTIFIALLIALLAGSAHAQSTTTMKKDTLPQGPTVIFKTTLGDFKVRLYDDTPRHRDNFLKLVNEGFYNDVLFHRVIKDFMVQTGDPDSKGAPVGKALGAGDPGYTIEAEILYPRHFHKYGALAAARTGDQVNPERRSSGSQFYVVTGKKYNEPTMNAMGRRMVMDARQEYFSGLVRKNEEEIKRLRVSGDTAGLKALETKLIRETEEAVPDRGLPSDIVAAYTTVGGTPHLDGQYTVFGEVVSGMDVIEKIQNVETDASDRPKEDVKILSATVEK